MLDNKKIDVLWDDNPIDVSAKANFFGALQISFAALT